MDNKIKLKRIINIIFLRKNRFLCTDFSPFVFIFPAVLIIAGIILYPVVFNLYISFFRVGLGGLSTRTWVGLENYKNVLTNKVFWDILKNTLIWTIAITFFIELISIISALLLNAQIPGRIVFRVILLLPWVVPGVVTGILWEYMFDAQFGVINDILFRLGLIKEYIPWLSRTGTSLYSVIVAYIWKVFPLTMIIILANLQSISKDVYEAALMDGASRIQILRYIELPLLKNAIAITTIFTIITAFNSFDLTYIMTGGGPVHSSEIIAQYIFNLGFMRFSFGKASAVSTLMFIVSFILIFLYVRNQNKREHY